MTDPQKRLQDFTAPSKATAVMWNDTASIIAYFSIRSPGGKRFIWEELLWLCKIENKQGHSPWFQSTLFVCSSVFYPPKARIPKLICLQKKHENLNTRSKLSSRSRQRVWLSLWHANAEFYGTRSTSAYLVSVCNRKNPEEKLCAGCQVWLFKVPSISLSPSLSPLFHFHSASGIFQHGAGSVGKAAVGMPWPLTIPVAARAWLGRKREPWNRKIYSQLLPLNLLFVYSFILKIPFLWNYSP